MLSTSHVLVETQKENDVTQKANDFCCVSFGRDTISKWLNAINWHYYVCFDNYSQAGFSSSPESAFFTSTRVVHAQVALSLKGRIFSPFESFMNGRRFFFNRKQVFFHSQEAPVFNRK